MAASKNPFTRAHYDKVKLTKQTSKRIERIYRQSAKEIKAKTKLIKETKSASLQKIYLNNLLEDINKSHDEIRKILESGVLEVGEKAGAIAVDAGNKAMKIAGLSLEGAYSYVPKQQVELLASGKLYGEKWSLSKAIWKNNARTKSDIQTVVAKGLAQNKPIKDIADDITKYVDPSARKPWDWNKVYPGTAQQVDYNAQRLARTMIQHSYQTSMVQSQLYNPFCRGIIWHSVGIHGRTCGLCLDRDGQIFPVKNLPLDHPNGLCYFEPDLDEMNNISDRLADWVNGESDPELDTYIDKAFNLSPKSVVAAKSKLQTRSLPKASKFKAPTENRATADNWVRERAAKQNYTSRQLAAFDRYMMESDEINGMLRGEIDYWDEQVHKIISGSMKQYDLDDAVYRGIDGRLIGLNGNETAEEAAKKLVGRTWVEKGFMSSSRSYDVAKEFSQRAAYDEMETKANVVLIMNIKGKKVSYLSSGLAEIVIDKGSKITFTDVVKKNGKFYVYALVK